MSSRSLPARITISEANSMPVVRRSSRGSTSRRTARMPQCASLHAGAEEEVEDAAEHRVADVAVQPGHRAGLDVASSGRPSRGRRPARAPRRSAGCHRSRRSGRRRPSRCSRPRRRRSRRGRRCRSRGAARARPAPRRRARARRCRPPSRCRRRSPRRASPGPPAPRGALRDAALDRGRLVEAGDHDRHLDGSGPRHRPAGGRACLLDGAQGTSLEGRCRTVRTREARGSRALGRRW